MAGSKNTVINRLSWKPPTADNIKETENNNTKEFLDTQFSSVYWVSGVSAGLRE